MPSEQTSGKMNESKKIEKFLDCCIAICRCMQNHNNNTIRRATQFLEKYTSHSIWKGFCVRGSWRPNRTATYWPPHSYGHQRFFPILQGCSTRGLGAQLSAGCCFLYSIISPSLWSPKTLSWVSRGPFCWVLAFSTTSCLQNSLNFVCTELYNSSMPTQYLPITGHRNMHFHRLWNGMFDRHWVEITVMQFTGHSLPVHQFVTVPWDFNPVPYCQPSSPTPKEYATSTDFGMACLAGSEVNIQQDYTRELRNTVEHEGNGDTFGN